MICPTCCRPLRVDVERTGGARITLLICDRCSTSPVNYERLASHKQGLVGMTREPDATNATVRDLLTRLPANPVAEAAAGFALNLFSLNCWALLGQGCEADELRTAIQTERNNLAQTLRALVSGEEDT